MSSAQCHGRLIAILAQPMTLHEAHIAINEGVSGSDPEFVSLKEVCDAGMSLVLDGYLVVVGKLPPGHHDITDSLHVWTGDKPLLIFKATALGLSMVDVAA